MDFPTRLPKKRKRKYTEDPKLGDVVRLRMPEGKKKKKKKREREGRRPVRSAAKHWFGGKGEKKPMALFRGRLLQRKRRERCEVF